MRQIIRILAVLATVVVLATACNGDDTSKDLPEARPLLEETAGKIQDAAYFKLKIDVNGYPVAIGTGGFTLPDDLPLIFQYAEGAYAAPDRLQADVQFSVGDFGLTADLIAIAENQYIRSEILTQSRWLNQDIIPGFSPMGLMAEDGGIASALKSIYDLEMLGQKDLDGLDVYHLCGQIEAEDVHSLTFGLIGTQTGQLEAEVYILTKERQIEQVVLHEPLPEGVEDETPTTWMISFLDYDQPVTIVDPTSDEDD